MTDDDTKVAPLLFQVSAVRACMEEVRRESDGPMPLRVRALLNATEHLCKLAQQERTDG